MAASATTVSSLNNTQLTSLHHGTLYLTISTSMFVLSGYLINIWLGRYLGPGGYGVYGVIISLMMMINLTQTSGLPQAISKFIAEDEEKADSILKSGLFLQVLSTLFVTGLVFFLASPIAHLLKDSSLIPYIQLAVLIFPMHGIYSLYTNYYNGLRFFKTQAFMGIIYSFAKLATIIVLVYFFRVYGAILGFIISPLFPLLFLPAGRQVFFHFPKKSAYHFPFKKLISFSIPLVGVAVFSNLIQTVDLFFVKALLRSDAHTGFYTANQNIAEIPFYLVTALASVLFPSISRRVSLKQEQETKDLILHSLRLALLIIIPSVLLLSATSSQVLRLLYSSAYGPGAESLSILAIGDGFFTFFILLSTIISGSGAAFLSALLAGAGVVISAFLCTFLVPMLGIKGAAFATTVASFVIMMIASIAVYKKFRVLFSARSVIKILLASFVIFFLAKMIVFPSLLLPLFYILLFGVYFLILIWTREITKEDWREIQKFIPSWIPLTAQKI